MALKAEVDQTDIKKMIPTLFPLDRVNAPKLKNSRGHLKTI